MEESWSTTIVRITSGENTDMQHWLIIKLTFVYLSAYAKGNERERFSPITGDRYPTGKNHNSTNLEVETEESTSHLKVPANQNKYNNNCRNDKGKFLKRSPSPYARENKDGKRTQTSGYKGRNFDENYQANKTKEPIQSTSKDKA